MVCLDLEPKSFGQGQGQGKKSAKFLSSPYLSNGGTLEVVILHKDCIWPEGVS